MSERTCQWCGAKQRDTFSFECGSVCANYVSLSDVQADSCRIGVLTKCLRNIVDRYPQRQAMLPFIQEARSVLSSVKMEKDEA